jgi:formylglycine-generating enzyme required for sulfatase activity
MKKTLLFVATVSVLVSFTQLNINTKNFIPFGTVQINDTLYYDKKEVSNFEWQEFVVWQQTKFGNQSLEYLNSLPDTLVWRQKLSYCEPYVDYYFRHPAYKDYPVVGITHEQAITFCKWRTERVKEVYKQKNNGKHINLEYKLPKKTEWQLVAKIGLSKKDSSNAKDRVKSNFKRLPVLTAATSTKNNQKLNDNADITAPCQSYWPNKKNIYNLFGNVAEMVQEKGICVGGSWNDFIENSSIEKTNNYTKAESWLGFRCICVVKN